MNNGGPAFPDPCGAHPGAHPPDEAKGMTLRDYFAAKCDVSAYRPLDSLRLKKEGDVTMQELADYIAILRFMEADAMLAARARGEGVGE